MKNLPRFVGLQYRTINIKTVSREALDLLRETFLSIDCARLAWVSHPSEEETPPHFHICASFVSPSRFHSALSRLYELDPHEYCKPCRNFRASVRYLAHLDNPEKCKIDPSSIVFEGDWDGVNKARLLERLGANVTMEELLGYVSSFRRLYPSPIRFSPIRFAIWLDDCAIDSAKVFSRVRSMGLPWEEILQAADDFSLDSMHCETSEKSFDVL